MLSVPSRSPMWQHYVHPCVQVLVRTCGMASSWSMYHICPGLLAGKVPNAQCLGRTAPFGPPCEGPSPFVQHSTADRLLADTLDVPTASQEARLVSWWSITRLFVENIVTNTPYRAGQASSIQHSPRPCSHSTGLHTGPAVPIFHTEHDRLRPGHSEPQVDTSTLMLGLSQERGHY